VENLKSALKNTRLKVRGITLFAMISKTQTLEGITSRVSKEGDLHIPMWDLENCTLKEAEQSLAFVQDKYTLSDIYILSDSVGSYRAISFAPVEFKTFCNILLDTEYLDWNFFYWTVLRSKATIRLSNKVNRKPQEIIEILKSYPS
jgi:hypothetical protein